MRSTMLNKARWRRWRRALRAEERVGGARGWWWRILRASMPTKEWETLQASGGRMGSEEGWEAWWEGTWRGTQATSLLHEFYEEGPSPYRTGWHRRQLWSMLGAWRDQTPLEGVLATQVEATMEEWGEWGRVGSSKWKKHRGEVVGQEQWDELLRDLRRRQQEREGAEKERRAALRRERAERVAEEKRAKRQEQEQRSAARLRASADRKRQPVLHRVDGENRGGVSDRIWTRGEGVWVRTSRPPGRGMSWLGNKSECTSVREAKQWPEGRLSVRQAVLGGWLKWEQEAEGTSRDEHQQGGVVETGEPDSAERCADAAETESDVETGGVGAGGQRMGPSEVNGVTPGDARESGIQALAEKEEEPPCERRMPEANHRTRARARVAATVRKRAGERMAGRRGEDCARGREQHEVVARRTARSGRAPEDKENQGMEVGKEGREQSAEGCRSKENHAPRRQPLGGAPPPPPPHPRQAQARVGRRASRSNTGAPAKPREGVG